MDLDKSEQIETEEYALEMNHIIKEFPGVRALDEVSFKVKKGEIHALCGENGAGKSTLMKVLSGTYPYGTYTGDIITEGNLRKFNHIKEAESIGVSIIFQEFTLIKQLSIGGNIFLGNEPSNGIKINWNKIWSDTRDVLKEVGLGDINPTTKVVNLGVGHQQLVEIAKAISKNAKILVLDEPTSALTEHETKILMGILNNLRDKGVTCIYISHKLEEVFDIADRITVLRDGKAIETRHVNDFNSEQVIALMVGRDMSEMFPRVPHTPSEDYILEVKNFSVYDIDIPGKKIVDNVSFKARKGEVLGFSGLVGAGRSELMLAIFGAYRGRYEGEVFIDGKKVSISQPHDAIKRGIAYLSEDRKKNGIVIEMDVMKNITLPNLDKVSRGGILHRNEEILNSNKYVKNLRIKTPSIEQFVKNLSGGNQQKVVLGKWLMSHPKILILDEPTRGIDVGAKYEIYTIINELIELGVVIIMISSELPEILGISDRILIMCEGKLNGTFLYTEANSEKIMHLATGGK